MSKVIRIENCSQCPSRDHKGAYGRISYIPVCRAVGKELPYEVYIDRHFGVSAHASNIIPEWCPLENG